jgi:DNA polymerase I
VFIPSRPGWHLVGVDYSQIELRILAHVTGEEGLIEAFHAGVDFHVATSAALLGIPPEAVTREIRDRAKAVNYGIIYGMGARSLAQSLEIDEKEAKGFIASYFARYPKVETFIQRTLETARATGCVSTIEGRRRYFRDIQSTRGDLRSMAERAAVNAVIQGSAADIMKAALVAIHRLLREMRSPARLLLTVHDEIVLEAPDDGALDELIRRVSEGMRGVADLAVPLEVSAGHGANWLEAHG